MINISRCHSSIQIWEKSMSISTLYLSHFPSLLIILWSLSHHKLLIIYSIPSHTNKPCKNWAINNWSPTSDIWLQNENNIVLTVFDLVIWAQPKSCRILLWFLPLKDPDHPAFCSALHQPTIFRWESPCGAVAVVYD